ncbi:MAG: fatty acid CoA ligase family protein [Gammaproteobacteria bacterium]
MSEYCNVAAALTRQARERPDAPAIHYPVGLRRGRVRYANCSYRELDELSDRYARGLLAWGLAPGARAALMVPPGREFFALFFALFKAGIVPVLIDPGIGLRPLRQCLAEAAPEAFIGVTRAQAARVLLRWARHSVRRVVTVGPRLFWSGIGTRRLAALGQDSDAPLCRTGADELAAILFTSGSTGVPKGVPYRHRHVQNQVEMLRDAFDIRPGEVDLATFPPFALFDPALGMTTVVPWMDPTRPAKADPALLAEAVNRFGVTNVFGSPALLRNLGRYAGQRSLRFGTVRRVLSAGAAVPVATVRAMEAALPEGAEVHTPYGATECLPVATICGRELDELDDATAGKTAAGAGICVGRPVPGNELRILKVTDEAMERLDDACLARPGEPGEIAVCGPTTTDSYWRRERQTRLAKMLDEEGRVWHRMGDIGYFDDDGRLWYCGRKSQRVRLGDRDLFPDQVEAVFNAHPGVERSALVGVGERAPQRPVLCIEASDGRDGDAGLVHELDAVARAHEGLDVIRDFLFHPGFPVDIRHNAKIGREALARWAAGRLDGPQA